MKKVIIAVIALLAVATFGFANDHGGMPPTGGGHDDGGHLLVASDGTIFVSKVTTSGTTTTRTVEAIRSTGTVAWTITLDNAHSELEVADGNLIAISDATASGATTPSTKLTAYSIAAGSPAWTVTLNGRVTSVVPFSGGIYVETVVPPATSGGTATRTLIAISNSGSTLWTLAL
jgi:hypothetical protein